MGVRDGHAEIRRRDAERADGVEQRRGGRDVRGAGHRHVCVRDHGLCGDGGERGHACEADADGERLGCDGEGWQGDEPGGRDGRVGERCDRAGRWRERDQGRGHRRGRDDERNLHGDGDAQGGGTRCSDEPRGHGGRREARPELDGAFGDGDRLRGELHLRAEDGPGRRCGRRRRRVRQRRLDCLGGG